MPARPQWFAEASAADVTDLDGTRYQPTLHVLDKGDSPPRSCSAPNPTGRRCSVPTVWAVSVISGCAASVMPNARTNVYLGEVHCEDGAAWQSDHTGASPMKRARAFLERLGWRGQEVEETVSFQSGGIALVLRSRGERSSRQRSRQEPRIPDLRPRRSMAGMRGASPISSRWPRLGDAHIPGFPLAEDGSITIPDFSNP